MLSHNAGLPLLILTLFFCSCKSAGDQSQVLGLEDEQLKDQAIPMRGPKQLKTLDYVFFRNNPPPKMPTAAAVQKFTNNFLSLPTTSLERRLLRKVFHDRYDLMTIASRDSDGDGIKDFRVSQYWGKFSEGDLDLDGDGIRNILDVDPYDPAKGGKDRDGDGRPDQDFADSNQNSVPDHLDFALLYPIVKFPDRARISEIQIKLYKDHKIILVERNQEFTVEAAEVIYDAIKRVFAETFGQSKMLPTLRSIATEDQVLLIPEEDGETNALVSAPLQTMIIYRSGLVVPPIVLLGLLTHEIGHSIQYADDYNEIDQVLENSRVYYPNPKYFRKLEQFDWKTDSSNLSGLKDFNYWVPAYEFIRPDFKWKAKTPDQWSGFIDEVYKKRGAAYMKDVGISSEHIVSQYSVTDPFEWLSDNQIAYIFGLIEAKVLSNLGADDVKKQKFRKNFNRTIENAWQGFSHDNFKGSKVSSYLTATMPISAEDLKIMTDRYGMPIVAKAQVSAGQSLLLNGTGRQGKIKCRPTPLQLP